VLRTHGVPKTSVISVRAGGTRRQAQLNMLDRPLKFPCKPEECATFKVDVLDLLGTGRLAYRPDESEYSLALDPPDETAPQRAIEVAFSIRRRGEPRFPDSGDDRHLSGAEEERALDEKREVSAREYLEKHGLTSFMQFLMQSLMKDKPSDPYQFLQKQVTKRMVSELSKCGDSEDCGLSTVLEHNSQGPPPGVSSEQLAELEQQAAAASEQLRLDNKRLRESAAQLKRRYWQLLEESGPVLTSVAPTPALPVLTENEPVEAAAPAADSNVPPAGLDETPQMAAYRDIASMQDEVCSLAKENGSLVEELSNMRAAIDSVRSEIESLSKKQALSSPT